MKTNSFEWPKNIEPPVCTIQPKELIAHNDIRIDNYYWLNDYFKKGPDSENVVAYLNAENAYYDTMMKGTLSLQDNLYNEMKARIKEEAESVPVFKRGYFYYSRQVAGKDYFVYCRKS